jgi:hypothetical protein
MHDRWYAQSRKQALFGGFPAVQFLIVLASLLLPAWNRPWSMRLICGLLTCVCALPLALLLLPPMSPDSAQASGALLAVTLLAIAALAWIRPQAAPAISVTAIAALVIIATGDLLTGTYLMRQAWMSYSVMEGARYYGAGNEYVGALFGAMMALSAVALRGPRLRHWPIVAVLWLLVCVAIGHPQLGADAGGFLGIALGVGVAAFVWWKGTIRLRDLLPLAAVVVLSMGLLVALDLLRSGGERSHLAASFASGGSLVGIATRKLMLNGYLLLHSPWALGLIAAKLGVWRLWREWGERKDSAGRSMRGVWAGLAAGVGALFLLNDSGVIAAAECLLVFYAAAWIQLTPPTKPDSSAPAILRAST